jgi:hypothetical protein
MGFGGEVQPPADVAPVVSAAEQAKQLAAAALSSQGFSPLLAQSLPEQSLAAMRATMAEGMATPATGEVVRKCVREFYESQKASVEDAEELMP